MAQGFTAGCEDHRSAIGSRVTAKYGGRVQTQEVTAQSSFYSVNDRRLHFGLGEAATADLVVRWTNGGVETFPNVKANQVVTIKEGAGIVRRRKRSQIGGLKSKKPDAANRIRLQEAGVTAGLWDGR